MAPNVGLAVALLAAAVVVLLLVLVLQSRRLGRLDARLRRLTAGDDGHSLEQILDAHLDKVLAVSRDVDGLAARTEALELHGPRAFQRIGLVRFNPFEDTGSNQSFALALLDGDEDGVVISSLHTRTATRIYAKAVASGVPESALSEEETTALGLARGSALGRDGLADRVGASDRVARRGS